MDARGGFGLRQHHAGQAFDGHGLKILERVAGLR
jgi:hypothetical protein